MPDQLTAAAIATLAEECPFWNSATWQKFLTELTLDEQTTLAQALEDSGVGPGADDWGNALKILETAATVVGAIVGIATGAEAIRAIVKAA